MATASTAAPKGFTVERRGGQVYYRSTSKDSLTGEPVITYVQMERRDPQELIQIDSPAPPKDEGAERLLEACKLTDAIQLRILGRLPEAELLLNRRPSSEMATRLTEDSRGRDIIANWCLMYADSKVSRERKAKIEKWFNKRLYLPIWQNTTLIMEAEMISRQIQHIVSWMWTLEQITRCRLYTQPHRSDILTLEEVQMLKASNPSASGVV